MRLAIVVVLVACASNKSALTSSALPKGPDCTVVAESMAKHMLADSPATKEIIRNRCDTDQWTVDARECLATMESERDADRCAAMLTETQRAALVKDERERQEAAQPVAAPPPPPSGTRSPTKRDSDPCQGGEEDPCQGGEREKKPKP
jgi:hypothetical protein